MGEEGAVEIITHYNKTAVIFMVKRCFGIYISSFSISSELMSAQVLKILQYINTLLAVLVKAEYWELSLRLFLQSALVCDMVSNQGNHIVTRVARVTMATI